MIIEVNLFVLCIYVYSFLIDFLWLVNKCRVIWLLCIKNEENYKYYLVILRECVVLLDKVDLFI